MTSESASKSDVSLVTKEKVRVPNEATRPNDENRWFQTILHRQMPNQCEWDRFTILDALSRLGKQKISEKSTFLTNRVARLQDFESENFRETISNRVSKAWWAKNGSWVSEKIMWNWNHRVGFLQYSEKITWKQWKNAIKENFTWNQSLFLNAQLSGIFGKLRLNTMWKNYVKSTNISQCGNCKNVVLHFDRNFVKVRWQNKKFSLTNFFSWN